jgi:hypothetical protein
MEQTMRRMRMVRERDLDVAGDDEALVEDAIEHVHEAARLLATQLQFLAHVLAL